MEKINIMISSVVKGLTAERDAIKKAFSGNDLVNLQGVDPFNVASYSSNSGIETVKMAKDCDLYILILTNEFGFKLEDGKSATEVEFDAAFRDDPTKILVFMKNESDMDYKIDTNQEIFKNKVCDYYKGYWRATFDYTHDLQTLVKNSFATWLKKRAAIGDNLTYLDHFVRIAKQYKPEPNSEVYYKLTKDLVEISYICFGKEHIMHFSAKEIYNNFWECFNKLQISGRQWTA